MNGEVGAQEFDIISLFPLLLFELIAVMFAIGFAKIARRVGRNPVLWAVLSLIPLVNYFFWPYALFAVVVPHMLDRLNTLGARVGASTPAR